MTAVVILLVLYTTGLYIRRSGGLRFGFIWRKTFYECINTFHEARFGTTFANIRN